MASSTFSVVAAAAAFDAAAGVDEDVDEYFEVASPSWQFFPPFLCLKPSGDKRGPQFSIISSLSPFSFWSVFSPILPSAGSSSSILALLDDFVEIVLDGEE